MNFTDDLTKEIERNIRQIAAREESKVKCLLSTIEMLETALGRLKVFISGHSFQTDEEEILFFKEIKPRMLCQLLFYQKIFDIEMERPLGTHDAQAEYVNAELDEITDYIRKRLGFYRYIRSGSTDKDHLFFRRGISVMAAHDHDHFAFERDPVFSTAYDFTVARILCNDMLQVYFQEELSRLGDTRYLPGETSGLLPVDSPRWTDKKSGLIAVLYSWDTMGSFDNGTLSLRKLQQAIEEYFGIKLGNIAKAFNEIRSRQNPTAFIDEMKEALINRIEETENRTNGYGIPAVPAKKK